MSLQAVRWWMWIGISVAVGAGGAWMRLAHAQDSVAGIGESLNGQRVFEESLFRKVNGRPVFDDVVVTAETLDEGDGARRVYVARGMYWDGAVAKDGAIHRRPAFYVGATPYRFAIMEEELTKSVGADRVAQFKGLENATMIDFFKMARAGGVAYRYEWWRGSGDAIFVWMPGSVLFFGLVIPGLINWTTYGRLIRPREKKEKAAAHFSGDEATPAMKAALTEEDLAKVALLADQVEAELTGGVEGAGGRGDLAGEKKDGTVVKTLSGGPVEVTVHVAEEHKDFGRKKDDYYPTEKRARR